MEPTLTADQTLKIAVAVVAITQVIRWGFKDRLNDGAAVVLVMFVSLFGVALWAWSADANDHHLAFDLFTAWASVTLEAAGVFGFTRATAAGVVSLRKT